MGANTKEYQRAYRARLAERGFDTPETKGCSKCELVKPASEFYKSSGSPDGLQSRCIDCTKSRDRSRERGFNKDAYLRRTYGITEAEFEQMKVDQGGRCAICPTEPKRWVVDHCHEFGPVRGLLCDACNTALGLLKDDPNIAMSMVSYLLARNGFMIKMGLGE